MFDIGWSEILVIAVVLIVVVGPKDLPPMIRAFGKMTANLRKMAGEFRSQFDEALREADMDDVRRTISDVQNLNPTNSLRDAMNPLRQLGQDIKSDLQKATTLDDAKSGTSATSATPASSTPVSVPEPSMMLPDSPPAIIPDAATPAPVVAKAKPAAKPRAPKASTAKAATAKAATTAEATTVAAKPAAKPRAKTASVAPAADTVETAKPVAVKATPAKVTPAKAAPAKAAPAKTAAAKKPSVAKAVTDVADKPAAAKKPVVRKTAATAKTAKKDEA
ncbi:Sec-independent protein translocase protein TatB [Agrobacterium sp. Azo12]|uniref:Sec-independent protein translocase protein TatB n=1 Tax=Agrobacterium sp. Azo12 TaxID=3031129 RepID=UPI0023D8316D|nr:Sec-independent protein translocase protein TatB [Agrobacterium sp. Azo12]MDO5895319.1 Sec-independent protein translocase protein TatB [Agrobacterium sp. Azo12]